MPRVPVSLKHRTGLTFNGSNTSVIAPGSFIVPTAAFSMALWYKPNVIAVNDRIVDQQDSGPEDGFSIVHSVANSPQVQFVIRNGATSVVAINSTKMRRGQWNLIVATFETNSAKLYVNAVQEGATDTVCTMTAPSVALSIGRRSASASNFSTGRMKDFAMFSKVLSIDEIEDLYHGDRDPSDIGSCDIWYKLGETSGTTAVDSSGNGRDGTIANISAFTESSVRSVAGTRTVA